MASSRDGQPAEPSDLVDVASLVTAYYTREPDPENVDEQVAFGTLRITARACLTTPPTEPPESAAFLEIQVVDPDREPETAFSGWMFASSPSLSGLEHPVYDVWLIECAEPLEPEPPPPPPAETPPPDATPPPPDG